jgi:uncharacterized protein (TIGR02145 family)
MKRMIVFLMAGALAASSFGQEAPTYAASAKTWEFGGLVWSDAIRMPRCNKSDFDGNKADCRSYYEGRSYYYYSWWYVDQHATEMCPSAWRVPTKEDFEKLAEHIDVEEYKADESIADAWGYGGWAKGIHMGEVTWIANYWSSTESDGESAYRLEYPVQDIFFFSSFLEDEYKLNGMQVRCVKDKK